MGSISPAADSRSARWRRGLSNVPVPVPHLAGVGAAVLLGRLGATPRQPPAAAACGTLLAGSGVLLAAAAWRAARPVDLARPQVLVVSGPYRLSRNPMYLAWLLFHAGAGTAAGSGWTALTLPAAALLVHRAIRDEERRLLEEFGSRYEHYAACTPRYLRLRTTQKNPFGRDG
ncbi:methyltransferase family protein [Paeniglutamicibacter psychrophenolicus]|uniref:methyltransferase family protein n=1 Tax=Paeniglutamicibacter psychrophenolicus TaxID=257454 RepID=UPI00277F288A|nr:isoprenylcysteine carboxylmethyltransferase family protein [Paeniglutamicibacter psychrophenolicus]MDQ0093779.1 protein-S-isoprenylcysteine O-methyltransferase Ste14 [Paeniglutamicibacter psychrophenolicus]